MSSTVWDHGPTMSFPEPKKVSQKPDTRRAQPTKNWYPTRTSGQPTKKSDNQRRDTPPQSGSKPDKAGAKSGSAVPQPSALGGARKPGPARSTVRDKWASMPQFATNPQPTSQLGGTRSSAPVLDTVRSRWAARQFQQPSPTVSENRNGLRQNLN